MRITGAASDARPGAPRARSRERPCAAPQPSAGESRSPRRPPPSTSRCARSKPLVSPARRPERSFTVTGSVARRRARPRRPRARPRRRDRARPAAPRPRPSCRPSATGQPMLMSIASAPTPRRARRPRASIAGSSPNSWIDTGPPSRSRGSMRSISRARLLVAVVDRVRRDHLRHRHARPVALGLQAHEPVADPRQRRQQHAVGHAQLAEHPGSMRRRGHARSWARSAHCGGARRPTAPAIVAAH